MPPSDNLSSWKSEPSDTPESHQNSSVPKSNSGLNGKNNSLTLLNWSRSRSFFYSNFSLLICFTFANATFVCRTIAGILNSIASSRRSEVNGTTPMDEKPLDASCNDKVHPLYGHGVCKWPGCEVICEDYQAFLKWVLQTNFFIICFNRIRRSIILLWCKFDFWSNYLAANLYLSAILIFLINTMKKFIVIYLNEWNGNIYHLY